MKNKFLIILCIFAISINSFAQDNDFGIWTSLGLKYKINKKWSLNTEIESRTCNNSQTLDRYSFALATAYKPIKYLKVGAEYSFLRDYYPEKTTAKGNTLEDYFTNRNRLSFSVTGIYTFYNFEFSLREIFQYTHRNHLWVEKSKDGKIKQPHFVDSYDRYYLRSRIQVSYPYRKMEPYISYEFYNRLDDNFDNDKNRFTVGNQFNFGKKLSLDV